MQTHCVARSPTLSNADDRGVAIGDDADREWRRDPVTPDPEPHPPANGIIEIAELPGAEPTLERDHIAGREPGDELLTHHVRFDRELGAAALLPSARHVAPRRERHLALVPRELA